MWLWGDKMWNGSKGWRVMQGTVNLLVDILCSHTVMVAWMASVGSKLLPEAMMHSIHAHSYTGKERVHITDPVTELQPTTCFSVSISPFIFTVKQLDCQSSRKFWFWFFFSRNFNSHFHFPLQTIWVEIFSWRSSLKRLIIMKTITENRKLDEPRYWEREEWSIFFLPITNFGQLHCRTLQLIYRTL